MSKGVIGKVEARGGIEPPYAVFLTLALILFCLPAVVYGEVDLSLIAQIESSNRPAAIGDGGKALGLYQLHQGVVGDYNRTHNTQYLHQDALRRDIATKVADWYLNREIPRLLKHFKLPVTTQNILAAYNAGIGNVRQGRIPHNYIAKYNKLAKEMNYGS